MRPLSMPTVPTIDLTALTTSMPWKRLTLAQKVFVKAYILNDGNALDAARKAYPEASAVSIRSMGWEVRHNPKVVAALDWWTGKDDRARLIELVKKQIESAEAGSVAASRLLAQLERLTVGASIGRPPEPKDGEPTFAIGTVLEQNGVRYRVEAIPMETVS